MRPRATTVAAGLLLISMTASVVLAQKLSALREPEKLADVLYLRNPKIIKFLSLGNTGLAANIYWTRAVQYFGEKRKVRAARFDLLQPLLQLTSDLDPQLTIAYEFGSIFLAQPPPQGAGDPDGAIQYVERGIRENPDAWRLYYMLGYIHYLEKNDMKAAAEAFDRGSQIPKAHPWMKVMAATMAQRGGDIQTSRFLWEKIYESAEDPMIRDNAVRRLVALRIDEEVAALEFRAQDYQRRFGQFPSHWQQMIAAGYLNQTPLDPGGAPYILRPDGKVHLADTKPFPFVRRGLPPGEQPFDFVTKDAASVPAPAK